MKHISVCLIVLLSIISLNTRSQNVISVGFDLSGGLSSVTMKAPDGLTGFSSKGGFVPGLGVSFHYYFDKTYGFASGVQLISFRQTTSGKDYYNAFETIDTENKSYERRIWGSNISEKLSIHLINIPLHFFYKYPFNRNLALFASIGPGISIPVVRNYSGSGLFTYKGYYPDTKVTLKDIPVYGFNSNVSVDTKQKLKTPFIILNASANAGFTFAMNRYYTFVASIGYFRTITQVAKNFTPHTLSNEIGSFNSYLNNGGGSLSNFSVSIGVTKDILF